MNVNTKKLVLNRETIRALQDGESRLVAGGDPPTGRTVAAELAIEMIRPPVSLQGHTCSCVQDDEDMLGYVETAMGKPSY